MKKVPVMTFVLILGLGLAVFAATTTVEVTWSSSNPNIFVTLHQIGTVWATVSGSGDTATSTANGKVTLSADAFVQTETAWQQASFWDMETYASSVDAYGDEGAGDPSVWWRYEEGYQPGFSEGWHTRHVFSAETATSGTVEQQASAIRGFRGVEGFQTYEATGANLVEAAGWVTHEDWKWRGESYVIYHGRAGGDVTGSQASIAGHQGGEYHTGFGAGIAGTEPGTYFAFTTNSPNPAKATYDITSLKSFQTVIIGSGLLVVGEAHTWVERRGHRDDPWDANFDWIEPPPRR